MKMFIIAASALALSFSLGDTATTWSMDKGHSNLQFGVTHIGLFEVKGQFTDFEIKITGGTKTDFSDISVTGSAKTSSISTGDEGRDKHLNSADFFNAEVNTELTFKSTAVKSAGKGMLKVTGDLTMNGITKSTTLNVWAKGPVDHPFTKKKAAGFKVEGKVKRADYKLGASMPAAIISEEVSIYGNFEVSKD